MIGILLFILKMIGIILLSILGLLLFLIILVLFVPIRYRFRGRYLEVPQGEVQISWLLRIIYVKLYYQDAFDIKIRILGIPLDFFQKRKTHKEKTADKTTDKADTDTQNIHAEAAQIPHDTVITNAPAISKTSDIETKPVKSKKKRKKKRRNIFLTIKDKILTIINSLKEMTAQIDYYIKLLQQDSVKAAIQSCKKRIFRLLRHILPRKGRIEIQYGMEDPASTAGILAIHGMLYPVIGNIVFLYPDFEQKFFQAKLYGKGRIYSYYLIVQMLCLVIDKNFRILIHLLKKERSDERK